MKTLSEEFGKRLVTLNTGALGLRGGIHGAFKDVGDGSPSMDFIGSDNSIDRYNEVIDQAGWQLDNFKANPVIPDCHDYSSIARILGRASNIEVKGGRLCNTVEFCLDNPLGSMAYKLAKGGFLKAQSVGFIPIAWTNGANGKDEPDRTYTKQELLEISLVVVPANPGATVGLMFKSALQSGAIEKSDLREVIQLLECICSHQTDPAAHVGASGAGVHEAQLLRSLKMFLGKT